MKTFPIHKLFWSILGFVVLITGTLTVLALLNLPQDNRQQASENAISCHWCGSDCVIQESGSNQNCITVTPPDNAHCEPNPEMTGCHVIYITETTSYPASCVQEPRCVHQAPFCAVDLRPGTTICKDADINGDNLVNHIDYDFLKQHLFKAVTDENWRADITHDGVLNLYDYAQLVVEWTRI